MKNMILAVILMAGLAISSGCATIIGVASESGLKAMSPTERATYRNGLDEVEGAIGEAKTAYDSRYDRDGNPVSTITPTE